MLNVLLWLPAFCTPLVSGTGNWIKVTNCSVECGGGGIQVLVRDCPASANGGKPCEGPAHKIEDCGYCPCKLFCSTACNGRLVLVYSHA